MSDAASAAQARATENARRAEVRREFTSAMEARIAVASTSGDVMSGVWRARAAAMSELCTAGERATDQVGWDSVSIRCGPEFVSAAYMVVYCFFSFLQHACKRGPFLCG